MKNEEKKRWIVIGTVSTLLAIGLGVLIYFQREDIEKARQEAANLKTAIAQDRELIKGTPELIKTVIVQRETDAVIQEILSNEADILNLVRTLHKFADESGVKITQLSEQGRRNATRGNKADFERVGYSVNFEGNAFHLLAFLNKVETHPRFMSVTNFKLQAAARNDYEEGEEPKHRVQIDLETYKYTSVASAKEVDIDHYDRKRDLLISEISKRAAELRIEPYEYRGARNRRDPWIDPRVPVIDGEPMVPIEEQNAIVAELVDRAGEAEEAFVEVKEAPNVIAEMKARGKLEELLAELTANIERVQGDDVLSYAPARLRFENQVVAVVDRLLIESRGMEITHGPSKEVLEQTIATIETHIENQEFELARSVYSKLAPSLPLAKGDDKVALVQRLTGLDSIAETVIEFEQVPIAIEGVAIYENLRPVALINGEAVTEGELVGEELVVRKITSSQIEFAFRGLVLARLVAADPSNK